MSSFTDRLIEIRGELGMNKTQFAKHIGSSPSTIGRWESGDMSITVDAVREIADKLKIEAGWLAGWNKERFALDDFAVKKIPLIGQVKSLPKIPKTELRVARVSEDLLNIKEVF